MTEIVDWTIKWKETFGDIKVLDDKRPYIEWVDTKYYKERKDLYDMWMKVFDEYTISIIKSSGITEEEFKKQYLCEFV